MNVHCVSFCSVVDNSPLFVVNFHYFAFSNALCILLHFFILFPCFPLVYGNTSMYKQHLRTLDDGWPESEKGTDVDVKYIEERRRCEKISEERMNI